MRIKKVFKFLCALMLCLGLSGCRTDEMVFPSEDEDTGIKNGAGGMYVLNEGNMGSNKCTIDYYDFKSGVYSRNIYAERNPEEIMELGDVGNDMAVYGSKIYITVNCSHKVEVLDAKTAKKIKQIDIPNCRYLAFSDGNAYVSSYIGPVGPDPDSPLGAVFRIDTISLEVTGEAATGYQPEEMAVVGRQLFVANSGGYRAPNFDNTISAISLDTFTLDYTVETGLNLHRLKADRYGQLWATSRGNYKDVPSSLICLQKRSDGKFAEKTRIDTPCDNFAFKGDSLIYFSSQGGNNIYGVIDILSGVKGESFIDKKLESEITRPYAIAVKPDSGEIFLTDAKNYVSSGTLFCINDDGKEKWRAMTGDIPAAIAFTEGRNENSISPSTPAPDLSAYISRVYEYRPAPGQFVNLLPLYTEGDTEEDMVRKCEEAISGINNEVVSLGGFGGYITFGFDHMVKNIPGEKDFRMWGNAVWQSNEIKGGSAEPGIVYVSYDENANGIPDDEWYELAGSEYHSSSTIHNYRITYHDGEEIKWTDSEGDEATMQRNSFHTQDYWPRWIGDDKLTFEGTRLGSNATDTDGKGTNWVLYSYPWGYADNYPNTYAEENSFDISWAVDKEGAPVNLPGIHFVKVMTGLNQQCGALGESSTEICKAQDLHYIGAEN